MAQIGPPVKAPKHRTLMADASDQKPGRWRRGFHATSTLSTDGYGVAGNRKGADLAHEAHGKIVH
jgi:hypothetical protein